MPKFRLIILFLLVALFTTVAAAAARPLNFRAHLSGAQENPPVETNSQGQAIFQLDSSGSSGGDGSVSRQEELTLRVAATVMEVLPNGVLSIQGTQEVRVNFELRELLVSGYIRPADISRQNEITYDKIAAARISYGGRGQITDVQQPRIGQQIADIILPF